MSGSENEGGGHADIRATTGSAPEWHSRGRGSIPPGSTNLTP